MPALPRRALPLLAAALARPALAQNSYPDRPISLVVPFLAGGSTDIAARILAERMAPKLGPNARIIVENRAGAGGSVGSEWVRHRPADGYTLLLASASALGTNPAAMPAQTPMTRSRISPRSPSSAAGRWCWWCRRSHASAAPARCWMR
ncbi:Bug family tripartite tricarboxylate transporter substrate binding protein [Siccirubricoccus deserti]